MSPILVPLFDALKWVTVEGFKLIGNMLGLGKDKAQIDKGTDEVSDGLNKIKEKTSMLTSVFKKTDKDVRSLENEKLSNNKETMDNDQSPDKTKNDADNKLNEIKTKNDELKEKSNKPQYNVGGYVHEDGEVHEGEYVVKESIVKKVGVTSIENVIKTMMQTSTKQIKQNPLKIISVMEGMAQEFAPMGEKLPDLINQTISESKLGTAPTQIVEKMQKTLTILKEQTDYEDPSATTIIIPVPTPSQPPMSGGGGGDTKVIPVGASSKDTLNRYMSAVIQKALY
jgi:hypothetical protein